MNENITQTNKNRTMILFGHFEELYKESFFCWLIPFVSTGTPSAVIAEIKSLSEFVTVSPQLDTGGLQSIVLHFAETIVCKVYLVITMLPFKLIFCKVSTIHRL